MAVCMSIGRESEIRVGFMRGLRGRRSNFATSASKSSISPNSTSPNLAALGFVLLTASRKLTGLGVISLTMHDLLTCVKKEIEMV